MSSPFPDSAANRLRRALESPSSSDRLQAALSAGTHPRDEYVPELIARCGVEPDFFVRDMLTWALMRHPADETVPRLIAESAAEEAQARSQALHALSKVRDPRGWQAISRSLLEDADDTVARTSWRAAALLAPESERAALADALVTQLGRGDRDLQLSLSRAFGELGEVARAALEAAGGAGEQPARIHAVATVRLIDDPGEGFDAAMFEAERVIVFG